MSKAWAAVAFNSLEVRLLGKPELNFNELSRILGVQGQPSPDKSALFVTWDKSGQLRGCIGTFSPLPTEQGVREYAIVAAIHDTRFPPIHAAEISQLEASVTLLSPLELISDPFDWELGKHGIQAQFQSGRSATFLPDVPVEFNWNQEETFSHLATKAGVDFSGDMGDVKVWRYQGIKGSISYDEYKKYVS